MARETLLGYTLTQKVICQTCQNIFKQKWNTQKYCSKICYWKVSNKDKIGIKRPLWLREKLREIHLGEKNLMWRGGVSSTRLRQINTREYRDWRNMVFERDNYTCQICSKRGGRLEADHIIPWFINKEKRFDLNNGQTLCRIPCHKEKTRKEMKENWVNQYTNTQELDIPDII